MTALRYFLACAILLMLCFADAAQSQIYKTVDADGNVVFTDIPPRDDDEQAQQIIVEAPNSFDVEEAIPAREEWLVDETADAEAPPFSYDALEIVAPANDEAVRENTGNVTIVANVSPRLQRDHKMRLLMDGDPVQEGAQGTFSMTNVDRGTHTLVLEIIDSSSNEVIKRSADSTFHMLRFAIRPTPRG